MKVLKTNLADFSFSSWFQAKFTFNIRQCSTAYLNYVPPPCSLKSPGNHYFKIVVFFRLSVFAKWSILELWKGSEYTKDYCCKILAKYLLMSTGKCWNKYSRLHFIYNASLRISHILAEDGYLQSKSQYSVRMREITYQINSEYGHFWCSFSLFNFSSTKAFCSFGPSFIL